jgi:hypothetical protein
MGLRILYIPSDLYDWEGPPPDRESWQWHSHDDPLYFYILDVWLQTAYSESLTMVA